MRDLFTPLTRDERQDESVRKWLQNKGKGTVVAATGVGFKEAVPIEESLELLQTNIGEGCDANTEISMEIKESIPSYSIGIEPEKSE